MDILPPLWSDAAGDGGLLAGGLFERIRVSATGGSAGPLLVERESALGRGGDIDGILDRPRGAGERDRLLYPPPYPPRLGGERRFATLRPSPPR